MSGKPGRCHQEETVAEFEKQFSRLDEAVANLKRVKANLKRYKAAILKAAVEGRLVPTEAALAQREGRSYETAHRLLARSIEARGSQRNRKANPPMSPDTSALPALTAGWAWASCDQLVSRIEAGASFKCVERPPSERETGVLKVSAVSWGTFDENESKTCIDPSRIQENYFVRSGDFLFSRANTIDLVGACVIVGSLRKRLMLSDKTLRFQLSIPPLSPWLLMCLRSTFGRAEIERLATGNQESMRNIGQERIRQIRVPVPPLAEQERIVAESERLFSLAEKIDGTVTQVQKRGIHLRHAILASTFGD